MIGNIASLCNALNPLQGQNIFMCTYTEYFCPDRTYCMWPMSPGMRKCWGHLDEESAAAVRINFCELRSDRLVIRYSPWTGLGSVLKGRPSGSLGKQHRLHILESPGFWVSADDGWIQITLKSGRVKMIDLITPRW